MDRSRGRFPRPPLIWWIALLVIIPNMSADGCHADDYDCKSQLDANDDPALMDAEPPMVCPSRPCLPNALQHWDQIRKRIGNRPIAICLDYDGTLTPHVPIPDKAFISDEMKSALRALAGRYSVSIITGRPLEKIRDFLKGIDNLYYAANHGLDITFDSTDSERVIVAKDYLPHLEAAYKRLRESLSHIDGCIVEYNYLSVSVHYRQVKSQEDQDVIKRTVLEVCDGFERYIRKMDGAKVWELRPKMDWDKGKALEYILNKKFKDPSTIAVYVGDDTTDEDAFKVVRALDGISILVNHCKPTAAEFVVPTTQDVLKILERLSKIAPSS